MTTVAFWWAIASVAAACGIAAAVGHHLGRRRTHVPLPSDWQLDPRPVLNADERQAMRMLRDALPHHVVLAKLPLVRLCQARDPQQVRYWFELLANVHVSFAICSPNGRVQAVIDLETGRATSARAERIKHAVLDACRIRHVRCRPGQLPPPVELELLLRPQGAMPRPAPLAPPAPQQVAPEAPLQPTARFQHARSTLSDTVKTRRAQRSAQWPDSAFAQDSFFAPGSQLEAAANSDFSPPGADAPFTESVTLR